MRSVVSIIAVFSVISLATAALADWNVGEPAKWVQMPDLTSTGMDVNATYRNTGTPPSPQYPYVKVLADDWQCYSTDLITEIHIWGSWLNDQVGHPATTFKLSIHKDVAAGFDAPYSHPGEVLWQRSFSPGQYQPKSLPTGPSEQFYDPNTDQLLGYDTRVFQYNFTIPESAAFMQRGTSAQPMIYWLDVQAIVNSSTAVFGWKTAEVLPDGMQRLDDAVYADTDVPGGPLIGPAPAPVFWKDMVYPPFNPYWGRSIDLAFVIAPEPGTLGLLLGGVMLLLRRRWN
jgi:hypothetical protein